MVRDDLHRLILKIGIIDAKVTVEPSDLASDELTRDEALDKNNVNIVDSDVMYPYLLSDFLFNQGALLILACKDGRDIACMITCTVQESIRWCAAGQRRGRIGKRQIDTLLINASCGEHGGHDRLTRNFLVDYICASSRAWR